MFLYGMLWWGYCHVPQSTDSGPSKIAPHLKWLLKYIKKYKLNIPALEKQSYHIEMQVQDFFILEVATNSWFCTRMQLVFLCSVILIRNHLARLNIYPCSFMWSFRKRKDDYFFMVFSLGRIWLLCCASSISGGEMELRWCLLYVSSRSFDFTDKGTVASAKWA